MTNAEPSARLLLRDTNLHVIFGVTLMAVLGVSTVAPVLPSISVIFDRTPQSVGLLISVFTVPGIVCTPVLGVLGDRIGRKAVLIPSLLLFAVAGAACGFARSFETLLVFRFVQGVGASALGALNVTILSDLYSGTARTTAMGFNASVLSIGTGIYPAVGGGLAVFGWYFPFFLPALAVPVAVAVLLVLDNPEPRVQGNLVEYLRVTLEAVWQPKVLTLFSASVVTFMLIYGPYLTFFPFLLEDSFAAGPVLIGMVMSITSVATGVMSFRLGALAQRFSEPMLIRTAFSLYAFALVLIPLASSPWMLTVPILLFGAANGINVPSLMAILSRFAPTEYRAAFMSLNGTVLRLGQTLGPVLFGTVYVAFGVSVAFYAGAILALGMLMVLARAFARGRTR